MIVGWRTAGHHRVTLVLDALVMAVAARRREGVTVAGAIHHSDAGSEYLAIRYGRELTAAGVDPSVGSVGDSYDNALAESMIGLYKTEVIAHQGPWRDLAQVETATATWAGWFNQRRGCSGRSAGSHRPNTSRPTTPANWARPPRIGQQGTRQEHREDQEDHVKEAAWPPLTCSGGLRPHPLGRCPRPRPSSEMGATPDSSGGAGQGHLLAGRSSVPPNPQPGQGRLRRRTRGRKRPPSPSGEPAAPQGLPDEEMPQPLRQPRGGPPEGEHVPPR